MALNEGASSSTIWLNVSDGRLVQQFNTPKPDTVERITKTGKQVFEKFYRDVTGNIMNVELRENDYGKQWMVNVIDGDEKYVVRIPGSSRYATSFLKVLPNINFIIPVKILPWSMVDKNDSTKKVTGITLYQKFDGKWEKVLPAYTKEKPNGLPEMTQVKIKGKMVWDSSEMDDFLEKMVKDLFAVITDEDKKSYVGENDEPPF